MSRIGQWGVKKIEGWLLSAAYRDKRKRVKLVAMCDVLIGKIFAFGMSLIPDEWFLPDLEEQAEKLKSSSPVILRAMIQGYMWDPDTGWSSDPKVPATKMYAYKAFGDVLLPSYVDDRPLTRKSWMFKTRIYHHIGVTGRHVMSLGVDRKWGMLALAVVFERGILTCHNRVIAQAIEKSLDFKAGKIVVMTKEKLNEVKNFTGIPGESAKMVEGPWSVYKSEARGKCVEIGTTIGGLEVRTGGRSTE